MTDIGAIMRETTAASQVIISIVPIVGIVMGCMVVFFYVLWGHRERMLMIERGQYEPKPFQLEVFSLLAGILLSFLGLVLTIVFILVSPAGYALLGGLIPLSLGIGLLAFYLLHSRQHPA
jgi:RsiW-degrading membrane proteinase PrsW (M82 family)